MLSIHPAVTEMLSTLSNLLVERSNIVNLYKMRSLYIQWRSCDKIIEIKFLVLCVMPMLM